MDFVTSLPISTNRMGKTYTFILVIGEQLTKIVHYEPVKTTIDTQNLAEVIINGIVKYYDLLDLIISDRSLVFNSKF